MPLNEELANLFRTAAAIHDIRGDPVFKSIAFSKVSRILESLPDDVRKLVENDTLKEIPGIGESSRKIIEDYVRTGASPDVEALRKTIPEGLVRLLEVPSLGPKTIALLWKERGITSLDELKAAIELGKLSGIKGLGAKRIDGIRQGIEQLARNTGRIGLVDVYPVARMFADATREIPGVLAVEPAGSLRRRRETIGDIDLLASVADDSPELAERVCQAFTKLPEVDRVLACGNTKASVLVSGTLQVDLRIVPETHYGAALLYFTGSKDHNVRLRSRALERGMTLNEWGLYRLDQWQAANRKPGEAPALEPVASRSEADVYRALGLQFIEPELREDRDEIALAEKGTLPTLITADDLRGDLHTHTTASDGANSIEQMAEAARELGYEYLAVTDHSKSQVIANGLQPDRLLRHVEQVRKVSGKLKGITLLAGAEVDILADGHLDYEDDVLKELDWVVASPHTALKQDEQKATDRLLRAIENRYVNVIGHPTGRLIGGRDGLSFDFQRLFQACVETGTAMEINSGWPRLDLDDVHARAAARAGVMLSINTDAHAIEHLHARWLGVSVARRAGVEARQVVNCFTLKQLRQWIAGKRR